MGKNDITLGKWCIERAVDMSFAPDGEIILAEQFYDWVSQQQLD
jgi:hypothetical protein